MGFLSLKQYIISSNTYRHTETLSSKYTKTCVALDFTSLKAEEEMYCVLYCLYGTVTPFGNICAILILWE